MEVIFGYKTTPEKPIAVALGNFDGVHIGHKHIIEELVAYSKQNSLTSAVFTFEPHPAKIFKPDLKNYRLTTLEEKKQILSNLGVEKLYVIKFDAEFAKITADDFIAKILLQNLKAQAIFTGDDFNFGFNRQGSPELLQKYSQTYNYNYFKISEISDDLKTRYSSSAIRNFLQKADVENANQMLGYNFFISRVVKEGEKRGRTIGFPTINFHFGQEKLIPKFGVYKTTTEIDGESYKSITNIGIRPTVEGAYPTCETHILNFDKNVYGKIAKVSLEKFIRPEQKFNSLDELKIQIAKDIQDAY